MHLVEAEFKRRAEQGEVEPKIAEQAIVLHRWFIQNYPSAPRLTRKTIENGLRGLYRRYKPSLPPK